MRTSKYSDSQFVIVMLITFPVLTAAFGLRSEAAPLGFSHTGNGYETGHRERVIILAGGALQIGMTKKEVFDIEGVPYRVKRVQDEDDKEVWIYRCMNSDGFNEDCKYLYFDGDELVKIERP